MLGPKFYGPDRLLPAGRSTILRQRNIPNTHTSQVTIAKSVARVTNIKDTVVGVVVLV